MRRALIFTGHPRKIILLLSYVILACFLVLLVKPPYIISILLVLVPPSLVNFSWLKKSRWQVLLFSLMTTLFFAPPVELVSRLADAWDVQSSFPRPFGLIPWENMLFAFLNFFWVISFYKYFVDGDGRGKISRRFKYLMGLFVAIFTLTFILYWIDPDMIHIPYYLLAIPILIIPGILLIIHRRQLIKKTLLPTAFFFSVFLVYELVSLKIGSWWWPGEYLYSIKLFNKPFPLDDVVIWYILSTPVLIYGYEYFMDDDQ